VGIVDEPDALEGDPESRPSTTQTKRAALQVDAGRAQLAPERFDGVRAIHRRQHHAEVFTHGVCRRL
jgi:hypothetical protein